MACSVAVQNPVLQISAALDNRFILLRRVLFQERRGARKEIANLRKMILSKTSFLSLVENMMFSFRVWFYNFENHSVLWGTRLLHTYTTTWTHGSLARSLARRVGEGNGQLIERSGLLVLCKIMSQCVGCAGLIKWYIVRVVRWWLAFVNCSSYEAFQRGTGLLSYINKAGSRFWRRTCNNRRERGKVMSIAKLIWSSLVCTLWVTGHHCQINAMNAVVSNLNGLPLLNSGRVM